MAQRIEVPGMGVVEFPDGMSDADIGAAIKRSTAAQPAIASAPAPDTLTDVAKSGASGLAEGAIGLAGMIPDIAGGAKNLANKYLFDPLLNVTIGPPSKTTTEAPPDINNMFGSQNIKKQVEGVTGEFYKPQTTAGEFAHTVGEFLPGSLVGPGGIGGRVLTSVTAGLGSEAAGQAAKGTSLEPYARVAGAFAGGLAPTAAARAATPMPANAARQGFVNTLEAEGVPLTAGQRSGSEALRYAESTLGNAPGAGGRASQAVESQGEAFTRAALRRAGENADRATPEVIDRAFTRIGNDFDGLAARNSLQADRTLGNALVRVENDYNGLVNASQRAPIITNTIRDIGDIIATNNGVMRGDAYQALRSRLEAAARASKSDPNLSEALRGIRSALDGAMERSIARTNPSDLGGWREARRQYKNMLVIEKAATGAGENAAQGLISPSQLRNATVQQGRRSYARGQGDFADLARAGEAVMKPLPQSGTEPRALVAAIPAMIGGGLGAATAGPAGAGLGAVFGHLAGAAAPGVAGRALMSRPVQAYLNNQALAPFLQNGAGTRQALLRAIMEVPRAIQSSQ